MFMKYNILQSGLSKSSQLGFGCAGVMSRVNRKHSLRMLAAALDAGITHFDVAPSYGNGDAEKCVGEALKSCRHKLVIATKFGVAPSQRRHIANIVKPLAQKVIKIFPASRKLVKRAAIMTGNTAITTQFTAELLQKSVEASLRFLQTDYIDILFLHDCLFENLTDEIIFTLHSLREKGCIKTYGVASSVEVALTTKQTYGDEFILQFANDMFLKNHEKISSPFVSHSTFANVDMFVKQKVFHSQMNNKNFFNLLLRYCLEKNPLGTVICSMLHEQHLQDNVKCLHEFSLTS